MSTAVLAQSIIEELPKKPKLVVDIGAGYGGIAINLALMGIKVIAVEPAKVERRVIKYFIGKNKNANNYLTITSDKAERLPIKDSSVDLCILSQVLEHVEDVDKTISEISRVLKPEGYCHLSSPNYLFPAEQHYHLPYVPMMPKRLFSKWAIFLLKTLNLSGIKNVEKRDFSVVGEFVYGVNYTTDKMITSLCRKYRLKVVKSLARDEKDLLKQIRRHWDQNPGLMQGILVFLSLPKKLVRAALANINILPMKLEYMILKK